MGKLLNSSSAWFPALCVITFYLLFYTYNVHPSVPYGDASELMNVAWGLGVAHPPGYPLFILFFHVVGKQFFYRTGVASAVANLIAYIRDCTCVQERAVSLHLVTVVLGAFTQLFVFLTVYYMLKNRSLFSPSQRQSSALTSKSALWVALGATYVCGTTAVIVKYSTESEVFGVHNFFVSLILFLFVKFFMDYVPSDVSAAKKGKKEDVPSNVDSRRDRMMCLSVIACALSLTNQHTSILLVAPVALSVLWVTRQWYMSRPGWLAFQLALFLSFSLGPYVYLWISEQITPHRTSWGGTDTWTGLIAHFLRMPYGTLQLHTNSSSADFLGNCFFFGLWMLRQILSVYGGGVVVILAALSMCVRVQKRALCFLDAYFLMFLGVYVLVFQSLANLNVRDTKLDPELPVNALYVSVVERFWMHPFLILVVWMGLCVGEGLPLLQKEVKALQQTKSNLSGILKRPLLLLCALLFAGCCFSFVCTAGLSRVFGPYTPHRENIPDCVNYYNAVISLESIPENGIVLVAGDILTMTARYIQDVELFRPDLSVLAYEMYSHGWYKAREIKHKFFNNVTIEHTEPIFSFWNLTNFMALNVRKHNRSVAYLRYNDINQEELGRIIDSYYVTASGPLSLVQKSNSSLCHKTLDENDSHAESLWKRYVVYRQRYDDLYGVSFFNWGGKEARLLYPWQRSMNDLFWIGARNHLVETGTYVLNCIFKLKKNTDDETERIVYWYKKLLAEVTEIRT